SAAAPAKKLRIALKFSLPRRQANRALVSGIGYHVSIAGPAGPVAGRRLTLPRRSPRTGLMTQMSNEDLPPHMRPERSFQGLILALRRYGPDWGCFICHPYDMKVGPGTSHPATPLRALGPKPWNAAYVQPSRRPKDGRYGENPNRLQHYYQLQVILKPSPED